MSRAFQRDQEERRRQREAQNRYGPTTGTADSPPRNRRDSFVLPPAVTSLSESLMDYISDSDDGAPPTRSSHFTPSYDPPSSSQYSGGMTQKLQRTAPDGNIYIAELHNTAPSMSYQLVDNESRRKYNQNLNTLEAVRDVINSQHQSDDYQRKLEEKTKRLRDKLDSRVRAEESRSRHAIESQEIQANKELGLAHINAKHQENMETLKFKNAHSTELARYDYEKREERKGKERAHELEMAKFYERQYDRAQQGFDNFLETRKEIAIRKEDEKKKKEEEQKRIREVYMNTGARIGDPALDRFREFEDMAGHPGRYDLNKSFYLMQYEDPFIAKKYHLLYQATIVMGHFVNVKLSKDGTKLTISYYANGEENNGIDFNRTKQITTRTLEAPAYTYFALDLPSKGRDFAVYHIIAHTEMTIEDMQQRKCLRCGDMCDGSCDIA